jgi:hypothetical protein
MRMFVLFNGAVDLLNPRLEAVGNIRPERADGVLGGSQLFPYIGPIPGGHFGSQTFLFAGNLLVPLSAPSVGREIRARLSAILPATIPIGEFGSGDGYIALAEGPIDATREGGQLDAPAGPRPGVALTVALTATLLAPEVDAGHLEPTLTGAVVSDRGAAGPLLLTREGISARITAPAGSRVLLYVDDLLAESSTVVPAPGSADVAFPTDPEQYSARLFVITPSGHGYSATWAVRVVSSPPLLRVERPSGAFGLSVRVSGETVAGASVTIDGQAVPVAGDGTFSLDVDAGLFPREVQVRATDAVGNEATRSVSVVAPFDYRRAPWIPIVVVLTVVAGAFLYLRVPRPSPESPRAAGDDAVLEEIE